MAVTVQIPTLPAAAGYIPSALMLNLNPDQATKLRRITQGLIADSAQLSGVNRVVADEREALLYLIEQAATP